MKKDKTNYYIAQADIAHELYEKEKGRYNLQWQGAAVGFKSVLTDPALFKTCLERASTILQTANA